LYRANKASLLVLTATLINFDSEVIVDPAPAVSS
jgi:hypothetical protein